MNIVLILKGIIFGIINKKQEIYELYNNFIVYLFKLIKSDLILIIKMIIIINQTKKYL